jgi:hypothetical protein
MADILGPMSRLRHPGDPSPPPDKTASFDHGPYDSGSISLRQVVVHMIEEYARHMGHADFLRERIDGRVGQ